MKTSNQRDMIVEGLDCANCAIKIEQQVQRIRGVKAASVNFITKKMTIEVFDPSDWPEILRLAAETASAVEPDVRLIEDISDPAYDTDESASISGPKMIRISLGLIIFTVALVFRFTDWIELGLFLLSYLLVGGEVVISAIKKILQGKVFDEHFLMSVATIGAFAIGQFAEGVAVMLFYQVGEFFQDLAVSRSRKSIKALLDIRPEYANLMRDGQVTRVRPEEIHTGDFIVIKPGEKIPLDGIVSEGRSQLDTSAITGEALPREIETGYEVYSGSINKNGPFTIRVTREYADSTVAKILDLVENANRKKAPTENFITKFARYYSPAVVFAALALAVIPPLLIPDATFADWIRRALVFLVISCPCALVISIPLGFFGGIGGAARQGILFKGSNYLEALNAADTIVFDKTGTLTKGIFEVARISSVNAGGEAKLLEYAAYAEAYSNHPIARSILHAYGRKIDQTVLAEYDEAAGLGTKVTVGGIRIMAGNARLMAQENILFDEPDEVGTVIHVAADREYLGYMVISDQIKKDAAAAITNLRSLGIKRILMFTGDSQATGDRIGRELGLDQVLSELLPGQKVAEFEKLEAQKPPGRKIIFVGDGINDAPVLARADVGIAMGGLGSDAAVEAADVVIMTDEPSKVAGAIRIARRTRMIVWQNILFAFLVKGLFLALGAAGLANMWEAVFADVGVAIIAVFNAMRVLYVKMPE
ncbi:MAG TPA: cadmium-translocating P-type ATPase [Clostridiales bacterium]|nr:cadmium-translocating P-type ATPase [Clostridiales bacterium]